MRIRISYRKRTSSRSVNRLKNKARIRKKISGTTERPRLAVFRSGKHIYAQLIDDVTGNTLASASTLKGQNGGGKNKDSAKAVGTAIAKLALDKNINNVVFDRGGYVYHGRIQALAEGAREAGLNF